MIRLDPDATPVALNHVNVAWASFGTAWPLDFSFLDSGLEQHYVKEIRFGRVLMGFTMIAVLLTCFGLFGLVSITTEERTREIKIRKLLGASVGSILLGLLRPILAILSIVAAFGVPLAYVINQGWLGTFAYHIDTPAWALTWAVGPTIALAIVTVTGRALRTASLKPIPSGRL